MATYSQADGTKILEFEQNINSVTTWTVFTVPSGETYFIDIITVSNADTQAKVEFSNGLGWSHTSTIELEYALTGATEGDANFPDDWRNKHAQMRLYPGDVFKIQTGIAGAYALVKVIATVHNG